MTKVSSSVSSTEFLTFDVLGQVTRSNQVTDGVTYGTDEKPMIYTYNLAGMMVEQTYPSGRKLKNLLNSNGDLSMILSNKNANAGYAVYANSFSYSPSGKIERLQLGNGRWENAKLNLRDQITELALGAVPTDTSMWKINYDYGVLQTNGTVDGAKNNDDMAKQTIAFAGQSNPYVQAYKYDSLRRLTESKRDR